MPEKFLVLGSNSFTGASFVDYALRQGNSELIGVSRSEEYRSVFLPYKKLEAQSFKFYQLDMNKDLDKIVSLTEEFRPDYIVNFAAQGMVAQSWEKPGQWFKTNTLAMVEYQEAIRNFKFIKKYVQISTPEVYGSCIGTVKESTPYNPSTPYAVSKAAADMSLMSFHKAYDFPAVFTRAANVYGETQQLYRIIPRTMLYFLTGKTLELHGGGISERSFIHISDVARATYLAAKYGEPGEIFHLSNNERVSIKSLVETIASKLGVSFKDNVKVVGDRLGKDSCYSLDSSNAKAKLAWEAKVSLNEGLDRTLNWIQDNLEELKSCPQSYIHKE